MAAGDQQMNIEMNAKSTSHFSEQTITIMFDKLYNLSQSPEIINRRS